MKRLLVIPFVLLLAGGCTQTLHGVIDDSANNATKLVDFTGDVLLKGADLAGDVAVKLGKAVVNTDVPDVPDITLPDAPGNSGNAPGQNKPPKLPKGKEIGI